MDLRLAEIGGSFADLPFVIVASATFVDLIFLVGLTFAAEQQEIVGHRKNPRKMDGFKD